MNDTLFPEYFRQELKKCVGILAGPLQIIGKILLDASSHELKRAVRKDQEAVSIQRAKDRNREYSGLGSQKHMRVELVIAFCVARNFYPNIFGTRGFSLMLESDSLKEYLASLGVSSFPSKNAIHDQVTGISESTLTLLNNLILKHVQQSGLDDLSALIIDSTAVEADSAWPVDSNLLKKIALKVLKLLVKFHSSLPVRIQRTIPIKRLQNQQKKLSELDFEISNLKGKKGAPKMRAAMYLKVLEYCQSFISRYEVIFPKLEKQGMSVVFGQRISEAFNLFYDKYLMVADRFKIAPVEYDKKTARKVYSLADDQAAFIKKGGRETIFGYRPNFGCSMYGFITGFTLEEGNSNDAKSFPNVLRKHIQSTGDSPGLISVDDGYSSAENLDLAIELGVAVMSVSGSKGKRLLGDDLYGSDEYRRARHLRSKSEGVISKLKNTHFMNRFRVCGTKRIRQELLISIIGYNLERLMQLLCPHEEVLAA
mgnify:CR=1 FL=1